MNNVLEIYYQSALDLGLPVSLLEKEIDGFRINMGKHIYYFYGGSTTFNNSSSINVASNKYCTNQLFKSVGVPVSKSTGVCRNEFRKGRFSIKDLKFPLVVKPMVFSRCGKGVLCNIQDMKTLVAYMEKCFQKYEYLLVEEFFQKKYKEYRVLMLFDKIIGVSERFSPKVIGDGKHNIAELIKLKNEDNKQFMLKEMVTRRDIPIDEEVEVKLRELGFTLDSVPAKGETVGVCYKCNNSVGGTVIAMGSKVCKKNTKLLRRAARVLGLDFVGFDIKCRDINIPIEESEGIFIEANHNPDITLHEGAIEGSPVKISRIVMKRYFYRHPVLFVYYFLRNLLSNYFFRCWGFFKGRKYA